MGKPSTAILSIIFAFSLTLLVPAGAWATDYALLIGATQYPDLPKESWLEGPARDVATMKELLCGKRFGLAEDNVKVLCGWPDDADKRPTKANIANAFLELISKTGEGDQAFVLFAGHGSLQPANREKGDLEPDGFDEIILPADAASWDEKNKTVKNAIVDDEVREWVRSLTAKGVFVWAVFDSCHSGTMTRGSAPDGRVFRQIDPASLVPAEALREAKRQAINTRGTGGGKRGSSLDMPTDSGGLVAMYAAQSIETTFEMPLPGPSDPRRGIFTFTIASVLSQSEGAFTYRDLADRITMLYRMSGIFQPCPMIEGRDIDRQVLGTRSTEKRPDLLLYRLPAKTVVDAGFLHGMRKGTVLEVFPAAGVKNADVSIGFVEITATESLSSRVKPIGFDGRVAPPLGQLLTGLRCRVAYETFDMDPICVAVQTATGGEDGSLRCHRKGAGPAVVEKVLKELNETNPGLVNHVETAGAADWFVRVQDNLATWAPKTGWAKQVDSQLPQASSEAHEYRFEIGRLTDPDKFSAALRTVITKVARAQRLMGIASSQKRKPRGKSVDVNIEVVRYPDEAAKKGEVVAFTGSGRVLHDGDIVAFRITNPSRSYIDVTLLFIDSAFGITPLFPEPGTIDDNRLQPGQTIETPRLEVSADTVGPEQVVAIAVRSLVDRQDFSCLAQASLGRTRGGTAMASPLGQLLQTTMFGEGKTRGLSRKTQEDYRTVLLPWYTSP